MSDKKRTIIFDLGGVLIGWDPRLLYRKMFDDEADIDRFFDEVDFYGWNLEQDRGRSFDEGVSLLSEQFPHYAEHIRAYDERYPESLSGPLHGTVAILSQLKQAGYPVYALSNWSTEKYEYARAHFEFLHWFDGIVVSGYEKLVKPEPEIFHVLLKRIGRNADECIFIDDSEKNIHTARELGFHAIRFESAAQLAHALQSMGIPVVAV